MPTYDYECDACGHVFEEFQSITARPLRVCPACGKRRLRRLIGTGAALLFKGSGFYATDYRSSDYKRKAKADAPSDSGKDASAKSDASGGKSPGKDGSSGGGKSKD